MYRAQLDHVVRVAAAISHASEIVVIGSQAILLATDRAPADALVSMDVDLYPPHAPEQAEVIDGAIGEGSTFHDTFGYYARGVGPENAALPADWREAAVRVESEAFRGVVAIAPAPTDLAISKLAAGREKDLDFVAALVRGRVVRPEELLARMTASFSGDQRDRLADRARRAVTLAAASPKA